MTRWARSGNSQRHQKQPEDPTPWEEFVKQRKLKKNDETKQNQNSQPTASANESITNPTPNNTKTRKHNKKEYNKKENFNSISEDQSNKNVQDVFTMTKKHNKKENFNSISEEESNKNVQDVFTVTKKHNKKEYNKRENFNSISEEEPNKNVQDVFTMTKKHNKKKYNKKENLNSISEEQSNKNVQDMFTMTRNDDTNYGKQNKKHKKKYLRNISADDIKVLPNTYVDFSKRGKITHTQVKQENDDLINSSEDTSNNNSNFHPDDTDFILSSPTKTSLQGVKREKMKFMEKLKQKRIENGILLLPPKVERKIYKMKKGLRFKGVPGENIKEIIRKIRRKEELKFRKTLRPCFKCRRIGHMFADCPLLKSNSEEGTGICFKCGSSEHTSFRCSIKTSEYPYATCFICKEQGHISRACPKNKHGIFPKGGSCNICGNVNHMKKDCPTLRKQASEEEEITLGTLTGNENVEEEDGNSTVTKFIPKKRKIISF